MTPATARVALHLPPEARSKSRNVNRYVKARLTQTALEESIRAVVKTRMTILSSLKGGQLAEAERIIRAVQETS